MNESQGASAPEMAATEVMQRKQMVETAQKLFESGVVEQADRNYGAAMDSFQQAYAILPDVPAVSNIRRAYFRRYQSATLQYAQEMISQAQWPEAKRALTEARQAGLEGEMPPSALDPGVVRLLSQLDDPEYYTTSISPQHLDRVEKVKQLLITAQGYLDYGDYDRAAKTYGQVLTIDAYNSAARRGMENVERHRMNYYAGARDQTRATFLRQIAQEWETPVPSSAQGIDFTPVTDTIANQRATIETKLDSIIFPSLELRETTLSEALDFIRTRSVELDFNEVSPLQRGINIVLDTASFGPGADPGSKLVTLNLSNVPLGTALQYVTRLAGASYRIDDFGVRVVSVSEGTQATLNARTWVVPPGFLAGQAGGNAPANLDPFANDNQGGGGGVLVRRKDAREFLEEQGVIFGAGALATYNPGNSTLLVRNTPEQLALIDSLVQGAREGVNKMVQVGVKMISITQEQAKQFGVDWLLGAFNVGSSPRVFAGGGTNGNSSIPVLAADVPFNNPGGAPVGVNPLTAGLRTGDVQSVQSIDDLLVRPVAANPNPEAPAVFSVAGVFTDPQFQSVLRMFTQSKGIDTLCDTKILIRPGQRGKLEVVREFIYPTEYDPPEIPSTFNDVSFSSPPVTPATPTAFEMRPLGKIVEVEPTLSADNRTVNVDVLLDASEFVGFVNYGTPILFGATVVNANNILMPVFDAVKETTNVTVWDGQTIAIGGYFGHSVIDIEDKIPFLGDLPAIGKAFRSSVEQHRKTGLIIFVTVRLVDPGGQPLNQILVEDSREPYPPRSLQPPQTAPIFAPSGQMPYQK